MGVLNRTPDSFSDGGRWTNIDEAISHAIEMEENGASVIDVGGESTRPGSDPVSAEEELDRLTPLLKELVPVLNIPVSVDTYKAKVAERCIDLGIEVVNDVDALKDPLMGSLCASTGVEVVLMHRNGDSKHMPVSMDGTFMETIRSFLATRAEYALECGIKANKITLDPGIGFGKSADQNMTILENSSFFSDCYPILSGSSRKRFLREKFPGMDIDDASAEAALTAARSGADVVRVHDVLVTGTRISQLLPPR